MTSETTITSLFSKIQQLVDDLHIKTSIMRTEDDNRLTVKLRNLTNNQEAMFDVDITQECETKVEDALKGIK